MKKLTVIFSFLIICLSLQAQQVKPEVINSMGGSTQYSGGYLAFNVGEPIVGTQSGSSVTLSQGFLQTWQILAKQIAIKIFLEGLFYDGGGNYVGGGGMHSVYDGNTGLEVFGPTIADTLTVELRNGLDFGSIIARYTGMNLQTDGNIQINNVNGSLVGPYYVTVIHRNSVPVASALPVDFSSNIINYDFTTPADKAYGIAAQKEIEPNVYAMYSGEQDRDYYYTIDGYDLSTMEPFIIAGDVAYIVSDLDGNGWVDGYDVVIMESNLIIGPYFQNPLTAKKKKKAFSIDD